MTVVVLAYSGIVVMLMLLALGFPVYLSMAITGFTGIFLSLGFDGAVANLGAIAFEWSSKWALITVPLFVLMGQFAFHSGISTSLYEVGSKFVGHLPGGLAMATTAACTGFGAVSGSSVANAAAMGAIAIPEMERYKYDKGFAAASVAAGGSIGTMMPPSTGFIIMGAITSQSIAALFLAGFLPAVLMMFMFMLVILLQAKHNPELSPLVPVSTLREKLVSLKDVWAVFLIFILVMGGIYIGYFTPTEAAAVGAFGTFIFMFAKKQLNMRNLTGSLADTLKITAMIFLIFIGASLFGNFLALSGLPIQFAEWLVVLPVSSYFIVAIILAAYIPMGCFMDSLSAIVVTLPIFSPVIDKLGFNMIWFLVLVEVMGEIGVITPPVGINVFILRGIANIPVQDIFRAVIPFVLADLLLVVILMCFPHISLFLPTVAGY